MREIVTRVKLAWCANSIPFRVMSTIILCWFTGPPRPGFTMSTLTSPSLPSTKTPPVVGGSSVSGPRSKGLTAHRSVTGAGSICVSSIQALSVVSMTCTRPGKGCGTGTKITPPAFSAPSASYEGLRQCPLNRPVFITGILEPAAHSCLDTFAHQPNQWTAVVPPSIRKSLPVMKAPSVPIIKAARLAISSGVAARPAIELSIILR